MKKNLFATLLLVGCFFLLDAGLMAQEAAQPDPLDQYIQMVRQDLRSERKQFFAANLTLTDDEATKFWPVFDKYTAEITRINDGRLALVKEYAANYDTLTDVQAIDFLKRSLKADEALSQLRRKYVPIVQKVLPAKKASLFFQMDRRLNLLAELKLASEIPVVE